MSVCTTCLQRGIRGEHECPGLSEIQLTRHLGRGFVVDTAPPRARIALTVLSSRGWGAVLSGDDHVNVADQVLYQVVDYDPKSACLVLELVEDWRPKAQAQEIAPGHVVPVEGNPAAAPEAIRQMDDDPHGLNAGMAVRSYREYGQEKWVFRCWGTDDGCDGLLSLDHGSQQGAERARDRHVAEAHTAPGPAACDDDPPVQCWHTEPDTPCDWDVCRQPERLAAGDRGIDPKEQP